MPRVKSKTKTPHPIRIDNDDWDSLKKLANKVSREQHAEIGPAELIRRAVKELLEKKK